MSTFKTNQQATIMRVQQTPAFFIHSSIGKEVQQESTFEVRSFGVRFFSYTSSSRSDLLILFGFICTFIFGYILFCFSPHFN